MTVVLFLTDSFAAEIFFDRLTQDSWKVIGVLPQLMDLMREVSWTGCKDCRSNVLQIVF